jgi:antitoxin YefM
MMLANATEARSRLYMLIDETAETHQSMINGKRGNAVLLSESDLRAITGTLHLLSVSGILESIRQGLNEAVEECAKNIGW